MSSSPHHAPPSEAPLRVVDVPLELCKARTNQPRKSFDQASLEELAASVERHGLLQPITVMRDPADDNAFVVVAGERRFRAFKSLGRETIPAIITSGDADELALIENLQREDLNPVEEAEALTRLQNKYNYTQTELGRAVGKHKSTISHLLKLATLSPDIKREVATSQHVSRSLLIEVSKLKDEKTQLAFWQEVKAKGMTVRQVRGKKAAPGRKTQATLARGRRFVDALEALVSERKPLSKQEYEELLDLFDRFVKLVDQEAQQQGEAS